MSFRPLRHGERFVMRGLFGSKSVYRFHARIGFVEPKRLMLERWMYTDRLCREDSEGVTWARGWNTRAAAALKVAVALGADQWPAQEYR